MHVNRYQLAAAALAAGVWAASAAPPRGDGWKWANGRYEKTVPALVSREGDGATAENYHLSVPGWDEVVVSSSDSGRFFEIQAVPGRLVAYKTDGRVSRTSAHLRAGPSPVPAGRPGGAEPRAGTTVFDLDADGAVDAMSFSTADGSRPVILVGDRLVPVNMEHARAAFRYPRGKAPYAWTDAREGVYELAGGKWVARDPATFRP